jgi:hypothetical protein
MKRAGLDGDRNVSVRGRRAVPCDVESPLIIVNAIAPSDPLMFWALAKQPQSTRIPAAGQSATVYTGEISWR